MAQIEVRGGVQIISNYLDNDEGEFILQPWIIDRLKYTYDQIQQSIHQGFPKATYASYEVSKIIAENYIEAITLSKNNRDEYLIRYKLWYDVNGDMINGEEHYPPYFKSKQWPAEEYHL